MAPGSFGLLMRAEPPLGNTPINIPIVQPPASHIRSVLAVTFTCLLVSWIIVMLRGYTRTKIVKSFSYDDFTMVIALLFFTGFCGMLIAQTYLVKGRDFLPGPLMDSITELMILLETFYVVTMVFLKISLGIFFLRILVSRTERVAIYVVLTISIVMGLAFFFFCIFQCGLPVKAIFFWQRRLLGQCVSRTPALAVIYLHGVINSATDLSLTLIPIPMLLKARINKKEKWIVMGIFSIATAGFTASIARLKWISAIVENDTNFVSNVELLVIFSLVEMAMGIIAGSLATLRPLLRSLVASYKSRASRSGSFKRNRGNGYSNNSIGIGQRFEGGDIKGRPDGGDKIAKPDTRDTTQSFNPSNTTKAPCFLSVGISSEIDLLGSARDLFGTGSPKDAQSLLSVEESGGNESLKRQSRYARFNPTPILNDRHSRELQNEAQSGSTAISNSQMDLAVPEIAAIPQRYQRNSTEESAITVADEGSPTSSKTTRHRATWWPLPRASILSPDE